MEFVDMLIANYEVKHFEEFGEDFELLPQPLSKYIDTSGNHYGVLIRFKKDKTDDLRFNSDSKFGRIMFDFYEDKYPAIDVAGDSYGASIFNDITETDKHIKGMG